MYKYTFVTMHYIYTYATMHISVAHTCEAQACIHNALYVIYSACIYMYTHIYIYMCLQLYRIFKTIYLHLQPSESSRKGAGSLSQCRLLLCPLPSVITTWWGNASTVCECVNAAFMLPACSDVLRNMCSKHFFKGRVHCLDRCEAAWRS